MAGYLFDSAPGPNDDGATSPGQDQGQGPVDTYRGRLTPSLVRGEVLYIAPDKRGFFRTGVALDQGLCGGPVVASTGSGAPGSCIGLLEGVVSSGPKLAALTSALGHSASPGDRRRVLDTFLQSEGRAASEQETDEEVARELRRRLDFHQSANGAGVFVTADAINEFVQDL